MPAQPPWPSTRRDVEQKLFDLERRLSAAPDDVTARFARACLLDQSGHADAQQAYLDVLARDNRHAGALVQLGALLVATGFTTAARTVLAQAVAWHPDDPAAQVSLGHLLRSVGETEAAQAHYQTALQIDPALPEAHQGLSYLFDGIDEAAAEHHRDLGFATRALTTRRYCGSDASVTVLQLVSARGGNVPTDVLLDDVTFLTHTLVAEYAAHVRLPPHDIVFNAIGDAERCGTALQFAEELLARTDAPVINPPSRILRTTRAGNATLGQLGGVTTPRIATVPRSTLSIEFASAFGFPFLMRSPGYHTGQNFVRVLNPAELQAALAMLPGDALTLIEPLDARGPDGAWRKYRVMMVSGEILPLHLAISNQWKVHHFTADMQDRPAHRREEEAFLTDMPGVLGVVAMDALRRITDALALDYGGIDFAIAPSGGILLFEANATMTVGMPAEDPVWDYRRPAVAAVLQATSRLILGRARKGSG